MIRGFIFFACVALFLGCAPKNFDSDSIVLDLPPQDLSVFAKDSSTLDSKIVQSLKQEYLKEFFSPYNQISRHKRGEIQWGLREALNDFGFGENLQPYLEQEIKALEMEANLDAYPSVKIPAIITQSTNLRVLPTLKPRFYNPKKAGEGFPFDYWQNSYIYFGTPVLITHYSRSKAWAYVESGFVSGWVRVLDIGILTQKQVKSLTKNQDFVVVRKDYTPLINTQGAFLESARIGMLLPLLRQTPTHFEVEVFVRDTKGYAHSKKILVEKEGFAEFPMSFSSSEVANLAQGIMGEKYGWGGMFGNRDCSMFLRDILGNFGFFLTRNSQAQMRQISDDSPLLEIKTQDSQEKKEFIKQNGIPFATLLGMPGHIMLYVGEKEGEIYVLHDVWGLRTLQNETQEGRKIIGKIALTSLEIGKGIQGINQEKLLIYRVYGMRNLFSKKALSNE